MNRNWRSWKKGFRGNPYAIQDQLCILDRSPEARQLFHLLPEELRMGSFVDRYQDAANGQVSEVVAVDEDFKKKFPALYDFVVTGVVGKKPRKTSTVTLFAESGWWKLCVNDRQRTCTLWRTGETVLEAVKAAEKAIQDGSADWRPNSQGSYQGKRS